MLRGAGLQVLGVGPGGLGLTLQRFYGPFGLAIADRCGDRRRTP